MHFDLHACPKGGLPHVEAIVSPEEWSLWGDFTNLLDMGNDVDCAVAVMRRYVPEGVVDSGFWMYLLGINVHEWRWPDEIVEDIAAWSEFCRWEAQPDVREATDVVLWDMQATHV